MATTTTTTCDRCGVVIPEDAAHGSLRAHHLGEGCRSDADHAWDLCGECYEAIVTTLPDPSYTWRVGDDS